MVITFNRVAGRVQRTDAKEDPSSTRPIRAQDPIGLQAHPKLGLSIQLET